MKRFVLTISLMAIVFMLSIVEAAPAAAVVTLGYLPTAVIKAKANSRNLTGNNNGFDVLVGTSDANSTTYDSGANFPWLLNGSNPVNFKYDGNDLTFEHPTLNGGTPTTTTYNSGDIGTLNYVQITVACRKVGTTVGFSNVVINGEAIPAGTFEPTVCGSNWYDWYITGLDLTGGFEISGSIDITGAATTGQEHNKVTIQVGALPQMEVSTADNLFCVGETTTVGIDINEVVGLYGYEFEMSYDDSVASAAGSFDDSFFDTTTDASIVPGWNASCSAGTCKFAVSKIAPATPLDGSGQVATIELTGLTPGTFSMAFSGDTLTDIDGVLLPHVAGDPLDITVCGYADITGKVTLQGRPGDIVDAGQVTMEEQDVPPNFSAVAPVSFDPADGSYSITVPYMPGGSSYRIEASHDLYLSNEETFTVNGSVTKDTRLWGGDANNDGDVTIGDLSCIGSAFGVLPVTEDCGGTGSPDINADAKVNIQDLSIAGGNFDKCGPQPWAWTVSPPALCVP